MRPALSRLYEASVKGDALYQIYEVTEQPLAGLRGGETCSPLRLKDQDALLVGAIV
jgi:hypothetical protein